MSAIDICIVTTPAEMAALRGNWDALSARFACPLLDHDWFLSAVEAFHGQGDLHVLTAWRDGELAGAAPIVREDKHLVLIGGSRLFEPADWLYSDGEVLRALLDHAIAMGEPLILQRLPETSQLPAAIAQLPGSRAARVVRGSADSLFVPTSGSWDGYQATLSSHVTANLARLKRKAAHAVGAIRVIRSSPAAAEVTAHLETLVAVEGSGWKGRRGSSLAEQGYLRDFFARYCHRAAASGRLRVTTLLIGDRIAAVELGVEAYRRMWQLKIGYEDSLRAYYPGLHLTEWSIRWAFEHGLEAYEFLGSAESWQERWNPERHTYTLAAVYPYSATSMVVGLRDVAKHVSRRVGRAHHRTVPYR